MRYLSLVEMLVACVFASVLFSLLLGAFSAYSKRTEFLKKEAQELLQERFLEMRLTDTVGNALAKIPRGLSSHDPQGQARLAFYTSFEENEAIQGQSLVFCFYNGVDISPRHTGLCLGRLYLDPLGDLFLSTWPMVLKNETDDFLIESSLERRELLVRNIETLFFEEMRLSPSEVLPAFLKIQFQKRGATQESCFFIRMLGYER